MPNIPDIIGQIAARRRTRNYDVQSLTLLGQYLEEYLVPIGSVIMKLTNSSPGDAWVLVDGQALSKEDFPDLYSDIGGQFGETATTFNLPDMANKYAIGAGTVAAGAGAGSNTLSLTVGQLPAHTHTITDPGHNHTITDPGHTHTALRDGGAEDPGGTGAEQAANGNTGSSTTGISINNATTGITVDQTGSGDDIDNRPLSMGYFFFIKARV